MLRRWRMELAKHSSGFSYGSLAPPSAAEGVDCHCARGIGTMRKSKPFDCGNPQCCICHWEKYWLPKCRAERKRRAIRFELDADMVE